MLLGLARDQKVDLTKISILALANQYLDFVEKAQALRLELAADYLVMASWLAYLKSRLLIPKEETKKEEPSANEMAEALQFQLRRLEAMRNTAEKLFGLPRLGESIFPRGAPEGLRTTFISKFDMTLYDILSSYGDIKKRKVNSVYNLKPVKLYSMEEAIEKMESMLGKIPQEWISLFMFVPNNFNDKIVKKSAVAATLGGALELVKRGLLELRQEGNYSPIFIRKPVILQPGEMIEQQEVVEEHISADEVVENEIDETAIPQMQVEEEAEEVNDEVENKNE
jgi:segregation and condensation protein A